MLFDSNVAMPASPDATGLAGTLVQLGWAVEENVFSGVGGMDTLKIAMSTAQDTLSGEGTLVDLVFVTKDIRSPASTSLGLVNVLFNDGDPVAAAVNGSLTIVGTDGVVDATPDSVVVGQDVTITVTDIDEDRTAGPDAFSVLAVDKAYLDSQIVVVIETGPTTGVFTGILLTEFEGTGGTPHDGTVGVINGDSICVIYTDSLSSVVSRLDTVEVIGGEDGVLVVIYIVQSLDGLNGVRDTIRLEVVDADLDLAVGTPDQVSVTVSNLISGESESVQLTETGPSTGTFQARVPTVEGASGTNDDGILTIDRSDSLAAVYNDNLTAIGNTAVRNDSTRVINLFGDIQSNDRVGAFDAAFILATAVGLTTTNAQDSLIMDVSGDDNVSAIDASNVLQFVVNIIDRFPVQTDTNLVSDPKNHPFLKPVPLDQVIAIGNLVAQTDGSFLVPVHLFERQDIVSGTFSSCLPGRFRTSRPSRCLFWSAFRK